MNIVQAKRINDLGKRYTYKVPAGITISKGVLLSVENKRTNKADTVIATSDSEDVSENVLNVIMQGREVISSVLGIYQLIKIGEGVNKNQTNQTKGQIKIELEKIPEDCYHCDMVDEYGYCRWINKYIDHYCRVGERYPTCPIEPKKGRNPEEAVEMVEKWAAEHTKKTRQSEFLKLHPNAMKNSLTGILEINPCIIDTQYKTIDRCTTTCLDCREEYWNAEVEEDE